MTAARSWPVMFVTAVLLSSSALAQGPAALPGPQTAAAVHRELPYLPATRDRADARWASLDLFLPPGSGEGKPPLLAFVHGGCWVESDDGYGIGNALARALVPHGVAVALIRYPLAPAFRFPHQPEHAAEAIAYLHRVVDKHGYDPKRVFLMGHSAGAHLASLVALDARYLRAAGAPPNAIAGVIAVSGIYDLASTGPLARRTNELVTPVFGSDADAHRSASPVTHVRRGAPPFLILSAEGDLDGFQIDARRFAARLRAAGNAAVQEIVMRTFDHFTIMNMGGRRSLARDLVLSFLGMGSVLPPVDTVLRARRVWQEPPVSTEPFRAQPELVRPYPVDERFMAAFDRIYDPTGRYELKSYPRETFYAIELAHFLGSQPRDKIGNGDHLVLTNEGQEKVFWRLSEIAPYQPVVVVGLDDERNLFRLNAFYHNKRAYSWRDEATCHSFRSTDVRAGHLRALDGKPQGGFALPLESYPPEVWRQFMFEHHKSAAAIGVRPNVVASPVAAKLHDIVVKEREKKAK